MGGSAQRAIRSSPDHGPRPRPIRCRNDVAEAAEKADARAAIGRARFGTPVFRAPAQATTACILGRGRRCPVPGFARDHVGR
jgi:hypothetical protein